MPFKLLTSILLIASAITLASMIPGGFVETRRFPSYPIWVLAGFNGILAVLGLGSLVLAFQSIRGASLARWAIYAGSGFVAVYLLDLAEVFPVSENPMSNLLFGLEMLGVMLGLALIFCAWQATKSNHEQGVQSVQFSRRAIVLLSGFVIIIVVFATWFVH